MQINSIEPIRTAITPITFEQAMPGFAKAPLPDSILPGTGHEVQSGNIVDRKAADKALGELAEAVEPFNVSLKFTRDDETGTIVIQMIDKTSGDTLLQIPNEASLHVAATLSKLQGSIFKCKA